MLNKTLFVCGISTILLNGCTKTDPILPGNRLDIFSETKQNISNNSKKINVPTQNSKLSNSNNLSNYAILINSTEPNFDYNFSRNIGYGTNDSQISIPTSIIEQDTIYTCDSIGNIIAWDKNTGKKIWKYKTKIDSESFNPSPQITFINNKLILTIGNGNLIALNSGTGETTWTTTINNTAFHGPLITDSNYLYTVSENNTLYKIDSNNGKYKKIFNGMSSNSNINGTSKPAINGNNIYFGLSTGDIINQNKNELSPKWFSNVYKSNILTGGHNLTDILSSIVIDENNVYAIGMGYEIASLNKTTGRKNWTAEFSSNQDMWITNNLIFITSTNGQLISLNKTSGNINYITQLPNQNTNHWFNPNLVFDGTKYTIWIFSEAGELAIINAESGEIIKTEELISDKIINAPIIENNKLHIITENGTWKTFDIN